MEQQQSAPVRQPWGAPPMPTMSAQVTDQPWAVPPSPWAPKSQAGALEPPTQTIPYADPDAFSSVSAGRAMGAPPSLAPSAVGAPSAMGVPPAMGAPSTMMASGAFPPGPVPGDARDAAARARALLDRTRSAAQERYKTAHEAHLERQALLPASSIPVETPEADPPSTPHMAPQPESEPHQPKEPAFFGQAVAGDGSTTMGVSHETAPESGAVGSVQWMDWIGKPKKRAKGIAKAGDRTDDQYLKLENGVLRFFKDPYHATPRKEIALQRVHSIRWSGMKITTPMETFRLRAPNVGSKKTDKPGQSLERDIALDAEADRCTELFRSMKEFYDVKQSYEGEKPHMDSEMNAMKVGDLLGGYVLYQPKRDMVAENCEQDVIRLSVALDMVMRQAIKNKIRYSGILQKEARKTGKLKDRHVSVDCGQFTFSEASSDGKARKQIEIDAMQRVSLECVTIVTDTEEAVLVNSAYPSSGLDSLITVLERAWHEVRSQEDQVHDDVARTAGEYGSSRGGEEQVTRGPEGERAAAPGATGEQTGDEVFQGTVATSADGQGMMMV